MTIILVRGQHVITMNAQREVLTDAAVAIENDRIIALDNFEKLCVSHPDAVIEGNPRAVITPGMINGHQHLTGDRLIRSMIPDTIDSQEAIFGWAVPTHNRHTERDDYLSAVLALNEALCHGITTTVEAGTVGHPASVLQAQLAMGTRGTLGSWGWDVEDGPFAGTVSEVLDRQREVMRLTADTPLIDGWVTLVGHDLMSDELVTAASQLARDNNTRITFHISPSSGDTASYLARTGKHPVRHLYDLGVLGGHVLLAHAVHLNDDEIDCIVETDTAVAVCPWAYLRLAQGITAAGRHDDMLKRGVRMSLGCDAENAGDAVDPIRNAALFAGLIRDRHMDPTLMSAVDALALHTIDAARAIGMADKIGSLEVGKQADLVVFGTDGPEWLTRSTEPILQLIWASSGSAVDDVYVAGKIVVRGKKSTQITGSVFTDIVAEAQERMTFLIGP